ncbi:MAG: hypothetical protein QXG18_01945 [Candidatus Pacearchaeota archaeon]
MENFFFYLKDYFISNEITLLILKIFFIFLAITIYTFFVYYTCLVFSKKNLLDFNLMKFINRDSFSSSLLGFSLYILEYLVIIPIFVFLWFAFYSMFLFSMANNLKMEEILIISSSFISSIRAISFFNEKLSRDIAFILPFTFLVMVLIGDKSISLHLLIEKFSQINQLINILPVFLIFIFLIEMIFRIIEAFNIFILKRE